MTKHITISYRGLREMVIVGAPNEPIEALVTGPSLVDIGHTLADAGSLDEAMRLAAEHFWGPECVWDDVEYTWPEAKWVRCG